MRIDLFIKDGLVFDGTGSEPFKADLGISGDKIVFVDQDIKGNKSGTMLRPEKVIDADGLSVAPGFIDTHSHSEFTLLADPRAEGKICQGITTEINGNCGLSAAPLFSKALTQREEDFKEFGIHERWSTFEEYFQILEKRGIAINFATLVGHGNIRASVRGYKDQELTKSDIKKMSALLRESISEGAIGLSTGLIYPPGVYSRTEELIEMAGCCKNLIYTSHMRSEGDRLIESIEETIRIGKEAGIKVHISHIKTSGEENWHKIENAISLMKESKKEDVPLTCDRYPYTASSTDLDVILPSWTYSGGTEEELKRLKSLRIREKIKKQILNAHSFKDYWKKVYISSVTSERNRWMEGKGLSDIARIKGREPVDILIEILIEEKLKVNAIFSSMHEENLKRFLSLSYCMIGTDSSARCFSGPTCKGRPHPRGFGSFPRFLGKYVRNEGLTSMSEGIHKITMLPAETFGINERGIIKKGAFADIVVFDHKRIIDRATFDEPFLRPEGIHYVLVNGLPAMCEGQLTDSKTGRILRHGR
ncbi:MAG: D-aminoacylase [Thermodesulfovibrionales bacterium]|nr:D-aminoacylase [Thermodesulfovibrionales bacterium]